MKKTSFLLFVAFLLLFAFVSCDKKNIQEDILAEYANTYEQVVAQEKSKDALRNAIPPQYTREEIYKMLDFSPDDYIDVDGNLNQQKFTDYLVKRLGADASVAKTSVTLMSEYLGKIEELDANSISTISSIMPNVIRKNMKIVESSPVSVRNEVFSLVAHVDYTMSRVAVLWEKNHLKGEKTLEIALEDCKRAKERNIKALNTKTATTVLIGVFGNAAIAALSRGTTLGLSITLSFTAGVALYGIEYTQIHEEYLDCVRMAHRDYGDKK